MTTTTTTPTTRTYPSLRAAWIPLTALCLAFFVEMVDNTLLSIALPTIGRDLHGTTTSLQWVTGAYALTFGGLMLTAGSVADRFGRRRVLLVGLAAFGTISLGALLVGSTAELIALRAALGLCAAAMAPITNSLVFRLFDDEALRRRAFPIMMMVGMAGFVLGPVLGGTALEHVGWEWLLAVNFVRHERRTASPMLDLDVFRRGTVRGATIAQLGTSVAMTGVMFSLVLHFQYAYGWSPVRAGLASLPMIVTMLLSNPLTESMVSRLGHRVACLVGAGLLAVGLVTMAYAVEHGYPAIVVAMVVMVVGLRTVMMTCAVALIGAMPGNRTSLGAALNDTAQELGTSVGTALVGTLLATLVVQVLPTGAWTPDLVASFFHGERIVFLVLAVVSGSIAAYGASTLTDSRDTEEA